MPVDPKYDDFFKQLTLDQIAVFEASYLAAVDKKSVSDLSRTSGGRDIGGYIRTIRRLNDQSKRYFGEPLLNEPFKKGLHWHPTATGRMFAELCGEIQKAIAQRTTEIERLMIVRPVRVAMPQFPLMELLAIEDKINKRLTKQNSARKFEKQLVHIRSEQLPTILLDNPEIDFAFGGLITPEVLDESLEFVELDRRRYNLITNFDFAATYKVSDGGSISIEFLREQRVPLIIAQIGVIVDCLLGTLNQVRNRRENIDKYLALIRKHYHIVEECNDVHFIIDLLCTSRRHLCMFGTPDIFMRAENRAKSKEIQQLWDSRGGDPPEICYHSVSDNLPPLHMGVIRRRPADEMKITHDLDHPARIFWETVQSMAGSPHQTGGS